jgi:hypothetical protein
MGMRLNLDREWRGLGPNPAHRNESYELELPRLGNPPAVRELHRLVKEKRPKVVFLIETKLRANKMIQIKYKLGFHNVFVVDCVGKSGGLALLWSEDAEVEIQNYSRQHINAKIALVASEPAWKFTGFYGHPDVGKRQETWSLLRCLKNLDPEPWLCVGDFNEILHLSEKYGGGRKPQRAMDVFKATLEFCELHDMGFKGPKYTWCNFRDGQDFIKERLDRVVANAGWLSTHPTADVEVGLTTNSDHLPIHVAVQKWCRGQSRKNNFRYEVAWEKEKECKEVIKKEWRKKSVCKDTWSNITRKLDKCKKGLMHWQKVVKQGQQKVIKEKTSQLADLHGLEEEQDTGTTKVLRQELNLLLQQEDLRWRQRAKVDWLKGGDCNSKYFHACATQRRKTNMILSINDEAGRMWDTQAMIGNAFNHYFSNLFTSVPLDCMHECIETLHPGVTAEMNQNLLKKFTREEVYEALKQMAPLKAPGPDGLAASFYQNNWDVVGEEVSIAVLDILNSGMLNKELNFTYITLVPKIKNPSCVTHFRPISLCNVLYKIVSKVLANRLKVVLPALISQNQSAFIPGRLISDNILAAYETLHTMNSRMWGKEGFMAIKLDMSKAYDRVEWDFLEEIMKRMGFARQWINLIMMCVRSVQYAVLINGIPTEKFTPTRGIRQGDPISPYLFLLCAEALSSLLRKAEQDGFLTGVPTSKKGPRINHLFFADDSLLFCKANSQHWHRMEKILETYEKASGQRLNKEKTSLFFSRNTPEAIKQEIIALSGIPSTQRYDHYLGLPTIIGRSKMKAFASIKDRVWKRLQDWKLRFLSQAGKEILLKAVIQAIPTYSMSVFLLPKGLCKEINSLMQNFWWSHIENGNRIHWMSWKNMGKQKNRGGMGSVISHVLTKLFL